MTVIVAKAAPAPYFAAEAEAWRSNYYIDNSLGALSQGEWFGRAANPWGYEGPVTEATYQLAYDGCAANGALLLQNSLTPSHFPAQDAVFTSSASMKVVFGTERDSGPQYDIARAYVDAAKIAMGLFEDTSAWTRHGKSGAKLVKADGILGCCFFHPKNRDGSPHPHVHFVVFTPVLAEGRSTAMLGITSHAGQKHTKSRSTLFQKKQALLDGAFQSALADEMEALGYPVVRGANGFCEIAGVPPALTERFSSRKREVVAYAEAHGDASPAGLARAARMTRAKKVVESADTMFSRWQEQAHGFDPSTLRQARIEGRAACVVHENWKHREDQLDAVRAEAKAAASAAGKRAAQAEAVGNVGRGKQTHGAPTLSHVRTAAPALPTSLGATERPTNGPATAASIKADRDRASTSDPWARLTRTPAAERNEEYIGRWREEPKQRRKLQTNGWNDLPRTAALSRAEEHLRRATSAEDGRQPVNERSLRAAASISWILSHSRGGRSSITAANVTLARKLEQHLSTATPLSERERVALTRVTRGRGAVQFFGAESGRMEVVLRTARRAWKAQGHRPLFVTPSRTRAAQVQRDSGIRAISLAGLERGLNENRGVLRGVDSAFRASFAHWPGLRTKGAFVKLALRAAGRFLNFDKKTVLIVEGASEFLELEQRERLLKQAARSRTRVIFVDGSRDASDIAGSLMRSRQGRTNEAFEHDEPERRREREPRR